MDRQVPLTFRGAVVVPEALQVSPDGAQGVPAALCSLCDLPVLEGSRGNHIPY